MSRAIFLLGAGASKDAGMLLVDELTRELEGRLPSLPDVNGNPREEFHQLFDTIAKHDPCVKSDYERFFEWIALLAQVQTEPFRRLIGVSMNTALSNVAGELKFVISKPICDALNSRHRSPQYRPEYLARLGDFVPTRGCLEVFTLNYDTCLEDACHTAGVNLTTGFDPVTKRWNPLLFKSRTKRINLYKLHGSLRWFSVKGKYELLELKPGDSLPNISVSSKPELILGPGSKLQADDPFLTLFYEFHDAMRHADACVLIGYGHRDQHVNTALERALDAGVSLLDVNPDAPCSRYLAESRYCHLQLSAKQSLMGNCIQRHLQNLADDSEGM